MHPIRKSLTTALVLACAALARAADTPVVLHHDLDVTLTPSTHEIVVRDRIELPATWRTGKPVVFGLRSGLDVTSVDE